MVTISEWDLDQIIEYSKTLQIDKKLAIKKYYEIYRYLREKPEYQNDELKIMHDAVIRTKNYLSAYEDELKGKGVGGEYNGNTRYSGTSK
jgi:hypothetical protein